MMKIPRILFVIMLLVAYPPIANMAAAHAETLPGASTESLHQQLYRAANEWNGPEVMYLTGSMFDRGEGVPQDYQEAFKWYVLAAAAGQAGAMNGLASCMHQVMACRRITPKR